MQIGRFHVEGELGRGAMGVVYEAYDPQLQRSVALKLLSVDSPKQRQRLMRESRALLRLNHPNVVELLDVGEHEGMPFVVMNLVRGKTLEDRLREEGMLEPEEVAQIGADLASALAAAHALGVVHRDVKPPNVLTDPLGRPVLTDFGLVKDLNRVEETARLTQSGQFFGTPGFWSPEQVSGRPETVGPPSDVYSLAATLYTLLTGRVMFEGLSLLETAIATRERAPDSIRSERPGVPRALDALILRCLAKAPAARPTAREVEEALRAGAGVSKRVGRAGLGLGLAAAAVVLAIAAATIVRSLAGERAREAPIDSVSHVASEGATDPVIGASALDSFYRRGLLADRAHRFGEAAAWFRKGVERGDVRAMSALGGYLVEGRKEVQQDPVQGLRLLRTAMAAGHVGATSSLGVIYMQGVGVKTDYAQARELLLKAAEAGSGRAMGNLGVLYTRGLGVKADTTHAVRWYRRGVKAGDALSMTNLGTFYQRGWGVGQDYARAMYLFRKAIQAGGSGGMARNNLGILYEQGLGVTRDFAEAVKWYRNAAQLGNINGMHYLGGMYEWGRGLKQDYGQAAYWYRKAAEGGQGRAMVGLAALHEAGKGVGKSDAQAVAWYRKAAKAGTETGMANLGRMYEQGRGVRRDVAQAVRWYRGAIKAGLPQVRPRLEALLAKHPELKETSPPE